MRFNTLDGLRGVAALLVLFYHLNGQGPIVAPGGYLAVDLFFGLSGFVIAHAYESRLRDGLTVWKFTLLRWVRIYPMAFVGAAIGVLLSGKFFPSLLLVPDFSDGGSLYPASPPLWSLVLELFVNIAFASVAVRIGWRGLAMIGITSAALLVVGLTQYRLADLGPFWSTIGYGLARTVFSFTLGVAMHRLHVRFAIRRHETRLAWSLPIALTLLLTQIPSYDTVLDSACVFLALPLILWLGTVWEAPKSRLFKELGGISYPLYCIHGVIVATGQPPDYLWIVLVAAAWWLNSRVDVPLRRWLKESWKNPRAGPMPA